MTETMKKKLKTVGVVFVSLILIAYIIYQSYMVIYDPVTTEVARECTVEDTVDTNVFICRKEEYINNSQQGTILSAVEDGSRVAKGQDVALIFSDNDAADNYTELLNLKSQIERYTRLANQSDNYVFNVDDLDEYIDKSVIELEELITEGKFTLLDTTVNDLRNKIVTRQIATGDTMDFQSRLSSLQAQYDALSNKSTAHSSITTTKSGYYIGSADGYENTIDYSTIKGITVDNVFAALEAEPQEVPETAIGKIVTEFTWYFVCTAKDTEVGKLAVGDKITINLPFSAVNTVEATVVAMNEKSTTDTTEKKKKKKNKDEDSDNNVAIVFSCELMNSNIATLRKEAAELVIQSFTGIKVPSSAIRVNADGEKGVYVQSGNMAVFKKVNIIYAADDYILSKAEDGVDGYVSLYDDIITKGKDLYDGKIIK